MHGLINQVIAVQEAKEIAFYLLVFALLYFTGISALGIIWRRHK